MEKAAFFDVRSLIKNLKEIGFDTDDIVHFFIQNQSFDTDKGSLSMLYKVIEEISPNWNLYFKFQ